MSEEKAVTLPRHGRETDEVKFNPLLHLVDSDRTIGLSGEGRWVVAGNTAVEYHGEREMVFLLPCLEAPYDLFYEELQSKLAASGEPTERLKTFPFTELIIAGLNSESNHWRPLALAWLEAFPLDEHLIQLLVPIAKRDRSLEFPQRVYSLLRENGRRSSS